MSEFECKLSELSEDIKQETNEKVTNTYNYNNSSKKEVEVEKKIQSQNDILSTLIDKKSNIVFIILLYIILNTDAIKELVFKSLPYLMESNNSYNLLGIFLSAVLLSFSSVLFTSYF